MIKSLDGSNAEPLLADASRTWNTQAIRAWSPDGRRFVFLEVHPENGADLWLATYDDDEQRVEPLVVTPHGERDPDISPDGKWLVYSSNETGRHEAYVRSFPDGRGKIAVSSDGGTEPRWSRNGDELFFRSGNRLIAVGIEPGNPPGIGEARLLFEGLSSTDVKTYDVFPDGERFLVIEPDPRASGDRFELIFGWLDELERLAPPERL